MIIKKKLQKIEIPFLEFIIGIKNKIEIKLI